MKLLLLLASAFLFLDVCTAASYQDLRLSKNSRRNARGPRRNSRRTRERAQPTLKTEWTYVEMGMSGPEPDQMKLWNQMNSAYTVMEILMNSGENPYENDGFSPPAWQKVNEDISAALQLLRDHPEMDFHKHRNLMTAFYTREPSGVWVENQVPVAHHLYRMYMGFRLDPARQLLVNVLRRGLDASTMAPMVMHRPSLMMSQLCENKMDLELLGALIDANASLRPVLLEGDPALPHSHPTGVSLLHTFSTNVETTILKKLLVIADEMSSVNMSSAAVAGDIDYVADVYRRLSRSHRATERADWQGHMYNVEYATMYAGSPTFRALSRDWNQNGPCDSLDRDVTHSINEELMIAILDRLVAGGLDIREVTMQQTPHLTNYFHMVVLKHQGRLTRYMIQTFLKRIRESVSSDFAGARNLANALLTSLSQKEHYLQRTPLHIAAAVYGKDDMFEILLNAEKELLAWFEENGLGSDVTDAMVSSRIPDGLGNLPHDYIVPGAANRTIPPHLTLGSKKASTINLFGDTHALDSMMDEDGTIQTEDSVPPGVDVDDPTASTTGGWDVYGSRPDLEQIPVEQVDPVTGERTLKEPCDIRELHHMPSKAEFAELVLAGYPFVIRNGADKLGIKRYLWTRKNFLAQYGDSKTLVNKIPYKNTFISFLKQEKMAQSSVWRESVGVDGTFELLSEKEQVDMEKITIRRYMEGFNQSDATGIPNYLFSTAFVSENPSLMATAAPAFDWAMDIHGIDLVFEGQMYVGPPGSGAPAHWHGAALNVMAYGKKRWSLTPPFDGAFYSVKPSLDFFQHDLPVLLNSSLGAEGHLLNFTQHSGDIVVLPREWGHATVNVESSIGLAYEFIYRPYTAPVDTHTSAQKVLRLREKRSGRSAIFNQPTFDLDQLQRQFGAFVDEVSQLTKEDLWREHADVEDE